MLKGYNSNTWYVRFREGEKLVIELGRALRHNEYRCKVFYMRLSDCSAPEFERLSQVCEHIVCIGADVGSTKRAIISQLASIDPKYNASHEMCRLRKKSYRTPLDVVLDTQKFGDDIRMSTNFEVSLSISWRPVCISLNLRVIFSADYPPRVRRIVAAGQQ